MWPPGGVKPLLAPKTKQVNTRAWTPLPGAQMAGAQLAFTSSLNVQLAEALFDRAGRDVESVGLGWIEPRG